MKAAQKHAYSLNVSALACLHYRYRKAETLCFMCVLYPLIKLLYIHIDLWSKTQIARATFVQLVVVFFFFKHEADYEFTF